MVLNFFSVAVSGRKMGEGLSVEHAFPKLDWGDGYVYDGFAVSFLSRRLNKADIVCWH